MGDKPWYYVVEQALHSGRDNEWGFRHWDIFKELKDARKCAHKLSAARIVKCQVVEEINMEPAEPAHV